MFGVFLGIIKSIYRCKPNLKERKDTSTCSQGKGSSTGCIKIVFIIFYLLAFCLRCASGVFPIEKKGRDYRRYPQ